MDEYRRNVKNHITPALGAVLVSALKAKQVQRFIDRLELEPRTVRNVLSPLVDALDAAIFEELCRENVARAVTLPELTKPELYKLSPEELQAFLVAIAGDRFEALYWLAMLGPRMGELLALRSTDFDADAGTITIRAGVRRLSQDDGPSELQLIGTKTGGVGG